MSFVHLCSLGLVIHCPSAFEGVAADMNSCGEVVASPGEDALLPCSSGLLHYAPYPPFVFFELDVGGRCDFDLDGESGTDQDIEAFFVEYGDAMPDSDWNYDGVCNEEDLVAFFQDLAR